MFHLVLRINRIIPVEVLVAFALEYLEDYAEIELLLIDAETTIPQWKKELR